MGQAGRAGHAVAADRRAARASRRRRSSPAGASAASSPRPARSGSPIPEELETEIAEELGGPGNYIFDIPNFREQGMDFVLDQVFKMTERRFQVARRLVKNKPWDYFMMVEMGPDRLHHVFWQYFDPRHPLYEAGQPVRDGVPGLLPVPGPRGRLAARASCPTTPSRSSCRDHGARPMMGGLCFNDWLIQEGYLAMTEPVTEPTPIAKAPIDWSRTVAWGDGGYYGRLLPQREGPRAAGHRRARRGTRRSATS